MVRPFMGAMAPFRARGPAVRSGLSTRAGDDPGPAVWRRCEEVAEAARRFSQGPPVRGTNGRWRLVEMRNAEFSE